MATEKSDAIVFFGATGDLAYKKIFPALQAMVRRGHLKMPVIEVAKRERTPEQIRATVRESLENHGDVDPQDLARLLGLLRYVSQSAGQCFLTIAVLLAAARSNGQTADSSMDRSSHPTRREGWIRKR